MRRGPAGARGLVIAAWAVFTVFGAAFWGYLSYTDYRRSLSRGIDGSRSVAELLDEHARRTVEVTQQLVYRITDRLRRNEAGTLDWRTLNRGDVLALMEEVPHLATVLVVDRTGAVKLRSDAEPRGSISGWRHFPELRAASQRFMVLPPPGILDIERGLALGHPVGRDGDFAGAVLAVIDAGHFAEFYGSLPVDRVGAVVLCHLDFGPLASFPDGEAGMPEWETLRPLFGEQPSGIVEVSAQGVPRQFAFRRMAGMPLITLAAVPDDSIRADWWLRTGWMGFMAAAAVLSFSAFSLSTYRSICREHAVREELQANNAALHRALQERTTLLQEIHHRVKNNLQIISSLLTIEVARNPEQKGAFGDTMARIQAMALVHQLLYESEDIASIDAGQYIERLTHALAGSSGTSVTVEAEPVRLDADRAVPLAMLVSEALSNAFKYGGRQVAVHLHRHDGGLRLRIRDDGPGFPPGLRPGGGPGLGTRLMVILADQLGGEVAFTNDDGGVVTLTMSVAD